MASFDVEDLVEDLQAALRTPGSTEFDNVSNTEMAIYLRNAFWQAYLDGFLRDFTESDGLITHRTDTSEEFTRDLQQLLILYTAIDVLRIKLGSLKTSFRAKAGSVEYETSQSATILKALLEEYATRREHLIDTLSVNSETGGLFYSDTFQNRQEALRYGNTFWVK